VLREVHATLEVLMLKKGRAGLEPLAAGCWMSDAPPEANAWYAWLLARRRAGGSPA